MRAKSLILLVIALGCGMIAAVGVSKAIMDKSPEEAAEASVEIFVAVKDLPHAQKVSADAVKLEKWPKSRIPDGALVNLADVEGKFTNQQIFVGEPILGRKLADSRESFSTAIPPGYRVFDIPGSAGYIKPGDHVDILGTFQTGGRGSVAETRTVMRNVQVFGINGVTTRDSDTSNSGGQGTVFQLLVKESQLEALTLANSMGELRMNLRPFTEDAAEGADNGESFLSWIKEGDNHNNEPVKQEQVVAVTQSLDSLFPTADPPAAAQPKHQMVIITPVGSTTYSWSDSTELPQVVPSADESAYPDTPSRIPSNQFSGTTSNVYSGYGGYTPTYPTSTEPATAPANTAAPNKPPVN